MLRNYFKIAVRNLFRHKAFSFINIAGLAIGMTCTILILLWVQDELSYDRFHNNTDNIYRIVSSLPELDIHGAISSAPLGPAVQQEIPEIKSVVRLSGANTDFIQLDDQLFEEKRIFYADSNFFNVFTYKFIEGDKETALTLQNGIVLTKDMAKKYFGNNTAVGKVLRKNHKDDFTVTAVIEVPSNSHLQFDFLQPMSFIAKTSHDLSNNVWDNFNWYTYVVLNENVDHSETSLKGIANRIDAVYKANEPHLKVAFELQAITDIHLNPQSFADFPGQGNSQYVVILAAIGVIILVVACINFMNLATARSARRAKEVGLRKVSGAGRSQLIGQFLAESTLISLIALVVAVALVMTLLPYFNNLSGKEITFEILDKRLIAGALVIALITGLLSGSYPALFLSSFLPVTVLKGNLKSGAASSIFRNALVVTQFTVSIALLVGTGVVYNQLHFIRDRNLGFDKENLLYVPMNGALWEKYQAFRTELERNQLTHDFSFVSELPTNLVNGTVNVKWEGKDPDSQPLFTNIAIDENFFNVFHTTLLTGRGFSKEFAAADSANLVVNEKALSIIGLTPEEAIGKPLSLWDKNGVIIGVVKDFNYKPIQKPIEPLILRLNTWGGTAVVRTRPGQTEATIKALENICKQLNPEYPFAYNFVDQDLSELYKAEQRLGSLFNVFAVLAVFISCLGLYGLSAFLAERRIKEIGVRKVLGASVFNLVYLQSQSFTRAILVSMLIATPLAWYAMDRWLSGFAFHVNIHWGIFAMAFLVALTIAWITVSYESVRAALTNPTESLRGE